MTVAFAGFQLRVSNNLRHKRVQVRLVDLWRRRDRVESRHREQPADHVIERFSIALHAVEERVLTETLARDSECRVHSRQGRPQLMRDVGEKLALTGD
jgi:hypothetical protein